MASSFALEQTAGLYGRQRAAFLKQIAQTLRAKDREKLQALKAQIAEVKKRRRGALRLVVTKCRRAGRDLRAQVKSYREQERARINQEVERMREAARLTCHMRKEAVKDAAMKLEAKAKRTLQAERQLQRDLKTAEQYGRQKERALRVTAREQQAESDDRVRANIDPELLPVWEKVKRSIKGSPKMSRTEAFLHWVEENPGDAVAIQQDAADAELKRLLREQREAEREAKRRRARSYRPSKAELAAHLEGVPF